MKLSFQEDGHVYRVDGIEVPYVTRILAAAGLGVDYSRVDPLVLQHARERGRIVDLCCDLFDQGDLDWSSVDAACEPYVRAWEAWRAASGFRPAETQARLYHPVYGYAGTADVLGGIGGRLAVVDRKCTSKISATYGVQLAAYALDGIHIADEAGELAPMDGDGEPPLRIVVQLKNDGRYRVVEYTDSAADAEAWLGALAVARWKARAA